MYQEANRWLGHKYRHGAGGGAVSVQGLHAGPPRFPGLRIICASCYSTRIPYCLCARNSPHQQMCTRVLLLHKSNHTFDENSPNLHHYENITRPTFITVSRELTFISVSRKLTQPSSLWVENSPNLYHWAENSPNLHHCEQRTHPTFNTEQRTHPTFITVTRELNQPLSFSQLYMKNSLCRYISTGNSHGQLGAAS